MFAKSSNPRNLFSQVPGLSQTLGPVASVVSRRVPRYASAEFGLDGTHVQGTHGQLPWSGVGVGTGSLLATSFAVEDVVDENDEELDDTSRQHRRDRSTTNDDYSMSKMCIA